MAKIIELIYTEERRGLGKKDDPVRRCPQLWTKSGRLVAEYDRLDDSGKGWFIGIEKTTLTIKKD